MFCTANQPHRQMKSFRYLIFFILVSFISFFLLGWYSGLFAKTSVEIRQTGPFVIAYVDVKGEYSETANIQDSLNIRLWEDGIENYQTFGMFYDDPKNTPVENLRSKVGCVIHPDYISKIKKLTSKYRVLTIEKQTSAVVELSYKNAFSVYAGIYKAYPALKDYCTENGYIANPIIEIAEKPNKLFFIMPLTAKK